MLIFGVSNVCLCVSVVAAWPWVKLSIIAATLRPGDSRWPMRDEGTWIKTEEKEKKRVNSGERDLAIHVE